jgi:hypothetical protein
MHAIHANLAFERWSADRHNAPIEAAVGHPARAGRECTVRILTEVVMACYETGTVVSLSHHEAISLPDVRGATLRVTQGTLWLTQEHARSTDIVLRPGDNWVVEHNGNTVVEAQNDAVFCIVGRKGAALKLPVREKPRRILASLAAFFTTPPRQLPYL